ncbi:MAG: DJ-1/PfpI family protein [Nitrososphaerota archaeon]|nr:DJ-1/PfpI family protein [Nitrososphaerota archaeon]
MLGSAGLLEGRRATTHHAFLEQLKTYGARVEMARAVSDGNVTTGGGISSSIDVGLELVRQTLGERLARKVSERTEYPPPRPGTDSGRRRHRSRHRPPPPERILERD